MKKVHLLAGFFILTSSSKISAQNIQADTIPYMKALQFHNLLNSNLRSSFYNWRNSQQFNTGIAFVGIKAGTFVVPSYNSSLHLSWWPQVMQLNNSQSNGYNAMAGFVQGFSAGFSATNNYYLKDAYYGELNKSFYSISSFFIGAGAGAILGLKDPRHTKY